MKTSIWVIGSLWVATLSPAFAIEPDLLQSYVGNYRVESHPEGIVRYRGVLNRSELFINRFQALFERYDLGLEDGGPGDYSAAFILFRNLGSGDWYALHTMMASSDINREMTDELFRAFWRTVDVKGASLSMHYQDAFTSSNDLDLSIDAFEESGLKKLRFTRHVYDSGAGHYYPGLQVFMLRKAN